MKERAKEGGQANVCREVEGIRGRLRGSVDEMDAQPKKMAQPNY